MQRGDETKVRRFVIGLDFPMAVVPAEKNDRLPSFGLKPPVDAVRLSFHFGDKILIPLNARAAGSPKLHKSELLQIVRILVEKTLDSPEPLHDSLCVINTIHAHTEEENLRPQLRQNVCSILLASTIRAV